jgi:hypothetical protein
MMKQSENIQPKTFFEDQKDALEEVRRIRASQHGSEFLIQVFESAYGGYCVKATPIEIAMDMIEDLPTQIFRK